MKAPVSIVLPWMAENLHMMRFPHDRTQIASALYILFHYYLTAMWETR